MLSPELQSFLVNTALPAIGCFILAHFHVMLPVPKSAVPVQATIRPIGQGGLIDIFGLLMAQVVGSSANPADKVAAVSKIAEAQNLITKG